MPDNCGDNNETVVHSFAPLSSKIKDWLFRRTLKIISQIPNSQLEDTGFKDLSIGRLLVKTISKWVLKTNKKPELHFSAKILPG